MLKKTGIATGHTLWRLTIVLGLGSRPARYALHARDKIRGQAKQTWRLETVFFPEV